MGDRIPIVEDGEDEGAAAVNANSNGTDGGQASNAPRRKKTQFNSNAHVIEVEPQTPVHGGNGNALQSGFQGHHNKYSIAAAKGIPEDVVQFISGKPTIHKPLDVDAIVQRKKLQSE